MLHSLSPEVALDAGVNAALLLHYIASTRCRETSVKRDLEGREWLCLPIKQLAPAFPYLSPATITRALAALEATGYLLRANLNRASFDRSYWYALTDKALGTEPQPPEPQPEQPEAEREAEREAEQEPKSEPEREPEPQPEQEAQPRQRQRRRWWVVLLVVVALLAVALGVFVILAHAAPDFIDSILYTPEELRIINA